MRARPSGLAAVSALVYLFLYAPILVLVAFSFNAGRLSAEWTGVTLPLSRPGVVAGSVLVFIPSLGAYLAPDLLGGARTVYMGTLIQSQFTFVRDVPFGAALSFLLSLVVLALLVTFRGPLRESRGA